MKSVPLFFTDSAGTGPPVVLVHAIGCDHRMWEDLGARLSKAYRVIAIDVRGHGRTPVAPRPYTLADMADDVVALLERLALAKAHWVGLSMGGMIGQAFALRHPGRLDRLVLANTTSSYGPEGRAMWQARARMVQDGGLAAIKDMVAMRYFSDEFRATDPGTVATVMSRFMETPAEGYLGCCDAIANLDFSNDLARIRSRTLVIAGGADAGTPPAMSEAIASKVPGAKVAVIPGAAHLSSAEKPDEFARLVEDFLAA
jgi:3-oxoadipate enol-lactonase